MFNRLDRMTSKSTHTCDTRLPTFTHLCQKENRGFILCIFAPGAGYDDATAGHEKEDDAVDPGGYYKYVWDISPKDGPTSSDPECLTYSYSSQVDPVRDVNSGLIGALLICKTSQWGSQAGRLFTVRAENWTS